jgi:hypothetical protein
MKKKIFSIFFVLVILVFGWYIFLYHPTSENHLLKSISSPNGNYVVSTYLWEGDSLSENSVTADLYNKKTKKTKEIYDNYPDNNPEVFWISNTKVKIGNEILDISKKETYSWKN